MRRLAKALIVLVAIEHLGFLVLEMFFWDKPVGIEAFHNTAEAAKSSAVLAGNQGLYNGFLAAGLLWSLWQGRRDTQIFFLGCVIVAGLYGAATAFVSILFVQAAPALLALLTVLASQERDARRAFQSATHRYLTGGKKAWAISSSVGSFGPNGSRSAIMAGDTTEKTIPQPVNDPGDVNPVYANYVQAWLQGGIMRLTYGEMTGGKGARFHTGVVMTAVDAKIFANLVLKLITDNEQIAAPPSTQSS
jgi:putative membrane protein